MEHGVSYDPRLDLLVHCLCRYERRLALEYLGQNEGAIGVEELATEIVRVSESDPENAHRARRQVSEALRYRHLPLLATASMVRVRDGSVQLRNGRVANAVDQVRRAAEELIGDLAPSRAGALPEITRTMHEPDEGRLSRTITDAIGEHRGEDLTRGDYLLFDDLHPEAVDVLFKADSAPHTRVAFTTESVHVELWSNEGVEIRVTDTIAG